MRQRPSLHAALRQRRDAAVLRSRLTAGDVALERALRDPALRAFTVSRVIQWIPGWGPIRTNRLLADLLIFPNRYCGELTERQRHLLGRRIRVGSRP